MSDYFPLLDLHEDLLEAIAVLSGASGYFFRLVCKRLLGIRSDLHGRTKAVLLEGNTKLFKLLPNKSTAKLSHAVQSDKISMVRLVPIRTYPNAVLVKIHHIKSVVMVTHIQEMGVRVYNSGRYHSDELRQELINEGLLDNTCVTLQRVMERGTATEVTELDNKMMNGSYTSYNASGGTNHVLRMGYIYDRYVDSISYAYEPSPVLTEERLDWLKVNTKVDMDLVSYNLSSVPMLNWRKKNGLIVTGVNTKDIHATRLCLSMISDNDYSDWVRDRSVRCSDAVARMLLNFCKSRSLPHPMLVRSRHLRWLIDECYEDDDMDWMLAKGVQLDVPMICELVITEQYVHLLERCVKKFVKDEFFAHIDSRRLLTVNVSLLDELLRLGYVFDEYYYGESRRLGYRGYRKWFERNILK